MSFQQVAAPQPAPGPVDLDRVEAEAAQFTAGGWVREHVPALVAELRAARAVIAAVLADTENEVDRETDLALDAYERVVGVP